MSLPRKRLPTFIKATGTSALILRRCRSRIHELPQDAEWLVHAAASPDLRVHNSQPIYASQTITQGTMTVLDCATRLPKLKGILNISSGYVYGYHSTERAHCGKKLRRL